MRVGFVCGVGVWEELEPSFRRSWLSTWLFVFSVDLCFQKIKGLSNRKDGSGHVAAFLKRTPECGYIEFLASTMSLLWKQSVKMEAFYQLNCSAQRVGKKWRATALNHSFKVEYLDTLFKN